MAACKSISEWKVPRRMRFRVSTEKRDGAGLAYLQAFLADMKRSGVVAKALAESGQRDAVHARLGKALLPTPDHRTADAHLLSNPLHRPTASRGKDNLSLPDVLALSVAVRNHLLQPLSVRRTHDHACRLSHDRRFARLSPAVNHQNGSQH